METLDITGVRVERKISPGVRGPWKERPLGSGREMWGTSFVCQLDAFNWVDSFVLAALVATWLCSACGWKVRFPKPRENHVHMLKLVNAQGLQLCGISRDIDHGLSNWESTREKRENTVKLAWTPVFCSERPWNAVKFGRRKTTRICPGWRCFLLGLKRSCWMDVSGRPWLFHWWCRNVLL